MRDARRRKKRRRGEHGGVTPGDAREQDARENLC